MFFLHADMTTNWHLKISAGELSTDPGTLEYRLRNIFELGRRWRIPLLLDEADVYLEQRKTEHIVRHSLVSVFLRMMEYFRGILVLTTKRVGVFDEAILSRIHVKLRYDRLDQNARMTVWKNLFEKVNTRSVTAEISQQEIDELVKKDLNGRQVGWSLFWLPNAKPIQIKNAISTASALAKKRKKLLSISHVQAVLKAGEMFDRDFHGTDRSESLYSWENGGNRRCFPPCFQVLFEYQSVCILPLSKVLSLSRVEIIMYFGLDIKISTMKKRLLVKGEAVNDAHPNVEAVTLALIMCIHCLTHLVPKELPPTTDPLRSVLVL
jgi:hypothetical protein